eukprot:3280451-Rhodomonas_salina.3
MWALWDVGRAVLGYGRCSAGSGNGICGSELGSELAYGICGSKLGYAGHRKERGEEQEELRTQVAQCPILLPMSVTDME